MSHSETPSVNGAARAESATQTTDRARRTMDGDVTRNPRPNQLANPQTPNPLGARPQQPLDRPLDRPRDRSLLERSQAHPLTNTVNTARVTALGNTVTTSGPDLTAVLASDDQITEASRSLKAMAHPLRLKILCILARSSEVSVQELVDRVGTSQSNISQHLSVLREKSILDSRKEANKVFYRIDDARVLKVMKSINATLC